MALKIEDYELALIASDQKECEVTGRDMGGTETHVCPLNKMEAGKMVVWEPSYGGYGSVKVTFLGVDDEAVHLSIYNGYDSDKDLKPGEEWNSGWYDFGSWSYHVKIKLQKIAK